MKTIKKNVFFVFASVFAAALIAACSSAPKAPVQKTELLDWKGAGLNQPIPDWVVSANDSNIAVSKLPDYKDQYCFAVNYETEGSEQKDRDFAIEWVRNLANGASQVSTMIATTVNQTAEAKVGGSKDQGTTNTMATIRDAMSNASFKGFRQVGDFWVLNRNKATKRQYYSAFSLWVVNTKELDQQMAAQLQNIIDNNEAMSAAERSIYNDIITNLRDRGLELSDAQR
ncbi:hypothetical protein FACS189494_03410 [Spirochaetia bacterium]|nr:hypothetical protein FACS189494_03410 [Spirochaetia bacterium]